MTFKKILIRILGTLTIVALITGWDKNQLTILANTIIIVVWLHIEWNDWLKTRVINTINKVK